MRYALVLLGWFFIAYYGNNQPLVVGPFKDEAQCAKIATQHKQQRSTGANKDVTATATDCWEGS